VQAAKLVVPRCTGEARVITTLCHTAGALLATDRFYFVWTTFASDYPAAAEQPGPAARTRTDNATHTPTIHAALIYYSICVCGVDRPTPTQMSPFVIRLNEIEHIDLGWTLELHLVLANCEPTLAFVAGDICK
jgi:hypothetical protein